MRFPSSTSTRPARMRRLLAGAATLVMLGGAAAGAWVTATRAADVIEARATRDMRVALAAAGLTWADAAASGLTVTLSGTAPDEATRFRAIAEAGRTVDPGRVIDRIAVAGAAPVAPPDLKVELLRNETGLTMIGLVPGEGDRRLLASELTDTADDAGKDDAGTVAVTDLLEVAGVDAPPGWDEAAAFGADAVAVAPRAKVSIAPGRVSVTALAATPAEKQRIEAQLKRAKPGAIALSLAISAPRPVLSPFTLRFVRDGRGARFDACAADSEAARTRILDAARAAGMTGTADCTLGLGVPTPAWAEAVVPAIAAVGAMGNGAVTFTDAEIALDAPNTVPRPVFDEALGRLQGALPPVFRLTATLEPPAAPPTAPVPAEFTASRTPDGRVTLRGRVPDERMRNVVESLARARFGQVDSTLRTDPTVPDGWTVRVIAALEAMADLASGTARVTPQSIAIDGVSGRTTASDAAAQALGRRLGAGADYRLAIRYDRRLDPALALPTGPQCVDRANAVMATAEIGFEPSRAEIAGDPAPTMKALLGALNECGVFRLEVGGHTDAQGSEGSNLALSRQRAEAVLQAMSAAGVDTANMTAAGYGESRPLASNETEAGREANRRIEFRLLAPEPVEPAAPAAVPGIAGVTAPASPEAGAPPLGLEPALSAVPAELAPPPPLPEPAPPVAEASAQAVLEWPAGAPQPQVLDRPVAVRPYVADGAGLAQPAEGGYIDPEDGGIVAD